MGIAYVDTRFVKNAQVEAVFEHEGVRYNQRFSNRSSFKAFFTKTEDRFLSGVDYALGVTIYPNNLEQYLNMSRKGTQEKKVAPKKITHKRYKVS